MKKRTFPLITVLAAVLILIILSVVIVWQVRVHTGAAHCRQIAEQMSAILPERAQGVPGSYPDTGMPVLELDGTDYAAMLEIPSFGLTLPVADKWDNDDLFRSPARYYGSAYDNSLIIGGADHPQQFDFCSKIEDGALITVTDMTGTRFSYTVARADRAKQADASWLIDPDCDLTLFCHDIYAMEYVAVRCVFTSG